MNSRLHKFLTKQEGGDFLTSGGRKLDKTLFRISIKVDCVTVSDSCDVSKVMPFLKPFLLRITKLPPVIHNESGETAILIDSDLLKQKNVELESLLAKCQDVKLQASHKDVELSYDNFSTEDALKVILPDEASVSGYSHVGHIVHLNLTDSQQPYKYAIAQILLDKVPKCLTVINKSENIEAEFRNLNFELLAGKADYVTRTRENGLTFELDYSKVFWNPRLSTERERLLAMFVEGDTVYDVFAGVGPFAIEAALKKRCRVLANDLNPDCVKYMRKNAKINKVESRLKIFNMCASQFLAEIVADDLKQICSDAKICPTKRVHFIMNLPALAMTFLKYFSSLVHDQHVDLNSLPKIYVYVYYFAKKYIDNEKGLRSNKDMLEEAETIIKKQLAMFDKEHGLLDVVFVRSVAPNKDMMRANVILNASILV